MEAQSAFEPFIRAIVRTRGIADVFQLCWLSVAFPEVTRILGEASTRVPVSLRTLGEDSWIRAKEKDFHNVRIELPRTRRERLASESYAPASSSRRLSAV